MTVESLEIRKEVLGEDHPQVAETLINLANVNSCTPNAICVFAAVQPACVLVVKRSIEY